MKSPSLFHRLWFTLEKRKYALAAICISLAARSVPEILSWPYPLGLDTLRYIPFIREGRVFSLGFHGFLSRTSLFYLTATLLYVLIRDEFMVIKVLGPVLHGALSLMLYLYAKRALGWSCRKSLLASILTSIYFVSLRISWDLYRQMLGFTFMMVAFTALKSLGHLRKYYVACILMALTVLSHELAAVTMFFAVGFEILNSLRKKLKKDAAYLIASVSLSAFLFLFQRYSPKKSSIIIPTYYTAPVPSLDLAMHIVGLLIYCYVFILPLSILGMLSLKDLLLRCWTILCVGIPALTLLNPVSSLPVWNRWIYLLVYPLGFYATEGLWRLWGLYSSFKGDFKSFAPKFVATVCLSAILMLSGCYLVMAPEHAFPYFSQYNPFLMHIPSSMLQSTVSIKDEPSLVKCLEWLDQNADESSVIVAHYALYDWAVIKIHDKPIIPVRPEGSMWEHIQNESSLVEKMVESMEEALANGYSKVYTVWWVDEKGWYGIPGLPSQFVEVKRFGDMGVFQYEPEMRC